MIDNDDLLYRIDRNYLGPAGHTFPARIRYAAAGVGAMIFTVTFVVARGIVHVPLSFKSLVLMLAITVVLTSKVTKYVNAENPLRSVFKAAWNDLTSPRPPKRGQTVVLRISRSVTGARPRNRR